MEIKIETTPVYEMQRVKISETEKNIYIAFDGKRFFNKTECENYEKTLTAIENGKDQFTKIEIGKENEEYFIASDVFGGYDVSCVLLFKWTATKDKDKITKAQEYLRAVGCKNLLSGCIENCDYNDGDEVLVASWIENENADRPSYKTRDMKMEEAIKKVDDFFEIVKNALVK